MKMKHWAMQYDHCKACGTTDIPHHGNGLCKRCYHREYKQNPSAYQLKTTQQIETLKQALQYAHDIFAPDKHGKFYPTTAALCEQGYEAVKEALEALGDEK